MFPDVIAEKEFTIESRGYNKDEVENILDNAVQISEESDPMSLVNNP